MSDATLIVTAFVASVDPLFAAAPETEPAHTASRLAMATATIVALRVDFMVLLLSSAPDRRARCESVLTYPMRCSYSGSMLPDGA